MVAHADDLRHWYAESIGLTTIVAAADGSPTALVGPLDPGRYILRVLAYGGGTALWVRQGRFGEVVDAAAAAPSTEFLASTDAIVLNAPLITFIVRGDNISNPSSDNGLSFFSVGGISTVHLTKISRDKR